MPARRFDAERMLLARRAIGRKQSDVAAHVGVSPARVSAWEKGRSVPDPEKLPLIAQVLAQDKDELFPREGLPDLADLRADAGYSQAATKELTRTKTAGPVAAAENGQRRLAEEYHLPLAEAYGVGVEALLRAQERSFGIDVPEPGETVTPQAAGDGLPETLAEKITYLLEQLPSPLSDAEVAALGNSRTRTKILTEDLVRDLRTGAVNSTSEEVLDALAEAVDTTPLIWSADADVQRIIAETMLLRGQVAALAARGGEQEGLSTALLEFIFREVDKARADAQGSGPTD
ncbi:transcriptional regulator with XRE-family HTH domain [Streptomyces sp. SAI-170]|uniref:helix-turn-helix domain-containing protein n=1 Tax=Streptomyces sp. SAI-170 TaxID=3377729 RepID=UPI003C7B8CB6